MQSDADGHNKIDEAYLDELVFQSQQGDKEAFGKLYDLLIDKVHRFIYFKVDTGAVEDLVAMAFVKIWMNIGKYNKKAGVSFQAWVFRLARNTVIDHHRFQRSLISIDPDWRDESREANPREVAEASISSDILKEALKDIKDPYRQIIILKFINEMSNEEIAVILSKKESAIRLLQFRALALLRKVLMKRGIRY